MLRSILTLHLSVYCDVYLVQFFSNLIRRLEFFYETLRLEKGQKYKNNRGNEKKKSVCVCTGCVIMCVGRIRKQQLLVFHLFKIPFH